MCTCAKDAVDASNKLYILWVIVDCAGVEITAV